MHQAPLYDLWTKYWSRWLENVWSFILTIYNHIKEEHLLHVQVVFDILQESKLYINLKKCEFLTNELLFLGFVIGVDEVKMD